MHADLVGQGGIKLTPQLPNLHAWVSLTPSLADGGGIGAWTAELDGLLPVGYIVCNDQT